MLGNHQARQERKVWGFIHVEVQEPLCEPRRCGTLLGVLLTAPRRTPLKTTVSRPSCRRPSPSRPGNNSPARRPSASAARCCSARQTPSGWSRGRDVSCCSAGPGARSTSLPSTCTDTTVIRFDDAQRHDARRRHARHPPHPDDNTRPNVRRKRSLGAQLPKPVYLFQRPQTCNRCETNPSR